MFKTALFALSAIALFAATADARPCATCQPCVTCAPVATVAPAAPATAGQPTVAPNVAQNNGSTVQRSGSYDPSVAPTITAAPVYRYRSAGRSFNDQFKASRKILGH